ncbi:MAG: DUF4115 domain-containing protein [Pseudomonadaceae bacterium]|nr:DUF4115 domain-containing protein [Pseudomonadaceae bacterium]
MTSEGDTSGSQSAADAGADQPLMLQGGPGPILAAAREDMGVSTREIADALNLPLRVVEGIEANDASVLPATAFARGYVRSYAKLFDLDADALVSAYEDMVGETHTAEVVVVPAPEASGLASLFARQPAVIWAIGAGVALLLVVCLVWLLGGDDAGSAAAENGAAAERNAAAEKNTAAEGSASAEQRAAPVDRVETAGNAARQPAAAAAVQAEMSDDDRVIFEPSLPEERIESPEPDDLSARAADRQTLAADSQLAGEASDVQPAAQIASRRRLTESGSDTLSIRFAEDSWLVIRDGEGRKLYSNLGKRGAQLAFVGQAPFRLVIGYAPGASLSFNGDPVALAPHTRNDVAKLFLGQ